MPESSGNKATLSCHIFFFCPWALSSYLTVVPQHGAILWHPHAVSVKPVGCHCGIHAVALGFPIFIVLEI